MAENYKWKKGEGEFRDGILKQKLSVVLSARGLFEVLRKQHFCVFRAALKVSCLKKIDIFSLKPFNINDNVEGKDYTLLHFASYHLSVASAEQKKTKFGLEKVVLALLNLGADALQLTEASSTSSSHKRKASSLSLMSMGFKKESKGKLSPGGTGSSLGIRYQGFIIETIVISKRSTML